MVASHKVKRKIKHKLFSSDEEYVQFMSDNLDKIHVIHINSESAFYKVVTYVKTGGT